MQSKVGSLENKNVCMQFFFSQMNVKKKFQQNASTTFLGSEENYC